MTNAAQYTKFHKFMEEFKATVNHYNNIGLGSLTNLPAGKNVLCMVKNREYIENLTDVPIFVMEKLIEDDNLINNMESFGQILGNVGLNLPFDHLIFERKYNDLFHYNIYSLSSSGTAPSIVCFGGAIKIEINNRDIRSYSLPNYFLTGSFTGTECSAFAITMLSALIVSLSTRGIVQEKIEAPKFTNEQRKKKGKPAIPGVTIIKIGHYYDKDGNKQEYTKSSPRVHWRRGHMRGIRFGPGKQQIRQQYIFPCLVNYVEGDEKPAHNLRVVTH